MYFERQHGLQCGLHATNNAVGAKVLIAADLNDAASEIALEMAVRARDAQQRRSTATLRTWRCFRSACAKCLSIPLGGSGRRTAWCER